MPGQRPVRSRGVSRRSRSGSWARINPHTVKETLQCPNVLGARFRPDVDAEVERSSGCPKWDPAAAGAEAGQRGVGLGGESKLPRSRLHPWERGAAVRAERFSQVREHGGVGDLFRDSAQAWPQVGPSPSDWNGAGSEPIGRIDAVTERSRRHMPRARVVEREPIPVEALKRRSRDSRWGGRERQDERRSEGCFPRHTLRLCRRPFRVSVAGGDHAVRDVAWPIRRALVRARFGVNTGSCDPPSAVAGCGARE